MKKQLPGGAAPCRTEWTRGIGWNYWNVEPWRKVPAELKLSPLHGGIYFSAGIGVLHLSGGAMQSWEHRSLRRGHLIAGVTVFDDSIMHLFLLALKELTTAFSYCKNELLLLRWSIAWMMTVGTSSSKGVQRKDTERIKSPFPPPALQSPTSNIYCYTLLALCLNMLPMVQ